MLAGGLGIVAIFTGLFAPLSTQCTTTTSDQSSCTMVSIVQAQGLASVLLPLEVFVVLSLGVALFTAWHSASRNGMALILLWVCTLLLCFNTLLALASIGLLFIPADVLALAAGIVAAVVATERPPAHA
jgi:hypothetical protein